MKRNEMTRYVIYYETYYSSGVNVSAFDNLEDMMKHLNYIRERNRSVPSYFNIECVKETKERINI